TQKLTNSLWIISTTLQISYYQNMIQFMELQEDMHFPQSLQHVDIQQLKLFFQRLEIFWIHTIKQFMNSLKLILPYSTHQKDRSTEMSQKKSIIQCSMRYEHVCLNLNFGLFA